MNSNKHSRASLQRRANGPIYCIEYRKGSRLLRDSGSSLEDAIARVERRLAKPHNKGEVARVTFRGQVLFETGANPVEIAWYKENVTMDEVLAHIAPKR